jgi:predicted anti-sigma-YlaC factor YlaD
VDCSEVLQQLADYLDEDARAELCKAIEAHLTRCSDCRVYVDTVKKTIVLYQQDATVPVPPQVGVGLQAALAREYDQERLTAD